MALGRPAATRSDGAAGGAGVAGCGERGRGEPSVWPGREGAVEAEGATAVEAAGGVEVEARPRGRGAGGSYVAHRGSHSYRRVHLSQAFREVLTWAPANTAVPSPPLFLREGSGPRGLRREPSVT